MCYDEDDDFQIPYYDQDPSHFDGEDPLLDERIPDLGYEEDDD